MDGDAFFLQHGPQCFGHPDSGRLFQVFVRAVVARPDHRPFDADAGTRRLNGVFETGDALPEPVCGEINC